MTVRVAVKPTLLQWAMDRSKRSAADLRKRFPRYDQWATQEKQPTLRQLEDFARWAYTPIGYFFLEEPPKLGVPIPDFRTMEYGHIAQPSPDLLETIYLCQQRQEWYRGHLQVTGGEPLRFIASLTAGADVVASATTMREALGFDLDTRAAMKTWEDALRAFRQQVEAIGVLVMSSGIVGSNTHRQLDPEEFRGFALVDSLAPLVFVNSADTKSGQMFTLAHELAHLWLGQSALSDVTPVHTPSRRVEKWCNRVAAELLVPLAGFRRNYRRDAPVESEMKRLARVYKVSTLVIIRRMHDARGLSEQAMWDAYWAELDRLRSLQRSGSGGGGDFYNTTIARTGERFATALVSSALEGNTLFREAYHLLGTKKRPVFNHLAEHLGVM